METSPESEVEALLTQYEKHLAGVFALVCLQPDFQRALHDNSWKYIKANSKQFTAIACWAVDQNIEGVVNTVDHLRFLLEIVKISFAQNKNVTFTTRDQRLIISYNG